MMRRVAKIVVATALAATSVVWATGAATPAAANLATTGTLYIDNFNGQFAPFDTVWGPDGNLWWVSPVRRSAGGRRTATSPGSRAAGSTTATP